jgi:hypothetical protein
MTVAYREETPAGWTDAVAQTWSLDEADGGWRLSGDCPTCGHPSETSVVRVTAAPGALPPRVVHEVLKVLVVCDCTADHEGRPAGLTGCGRAGYLELRDES